MTCGSCQYYDENNTSGYKGYCTYIKAYVDPDEAACSHHKSRESGGGCYLTSACCACRGLPDDCRELTAMRRLREYYLKNSEDGYGIVTEYYRTAPVIVEKIDASPDRAGLYDRIYETAKCCAALVEKGDYEGAKSAYLAMVERLKQRFLTGGEPIPGASPAAR